MWCKKITMPSSQSPISCRYQNLEEGCQMRFSVRLMMARTTEFDTEYSFQFAQNLRVRNGFARFIVLNDGWFLVNFLRYILLRQFKVSAGSLHSLYDEYHHKLDPKLTKRQHTRPTDGRILGGGATSFSRSSLTMRW